MNDSLLTHKNTPRKKTVQESVNKKCFSKLKVI